MTHVPELSVVVLCYRAGAGALELADQLAGELDQAGIDHELILVANHHAGDGDPTPELVREYTARHPRDRDHAGEGRHDGLGHAGGAGGRARGAPGGDRR
jgi:hypothetical protein